MAICPLAHVPEGAVFRVRDGEYTSLAHGGSSRTDRDRQESKCPWWRLGRRGQGRERVGSQPSTPYLEAALLSCSISASLRLALRHSRCQSTPSSLPPPPLCPLPPPSAQPPSCSPLRVACRRQVRVSCARKDLGATYFQGEIAGNIQIQASLRVRVAFAAVMEMMNCGKRRHSQARG